MRTRIILDGNAFYEIDEECMGKKEEQKRISQMPKEMQNRNSIENRTNNGRMQKGGRE